MIQLASSPERIIIDTRMLTNPKIELFDTILKVSSLTADHVRRTVVTKRPGQKEDFH